MQDYEVWRRLHPLSSWRKAHGMTRAELAGRLGISETMLGRYESGTSRPGPELMEKMIALTGWRQRI